MNPGTKFGFLHSKPFFAQLALASSVFASDQTARDGKVPMEQSVEWWHALEALHVPAKLVVHTNEGHAIMKPADARDYELCSLNWFEEWFEKASKPASAPGQ